MLQVGKVNFDATDLFVMGRTNSTKWDYLRGKWDIFPKISYVGCTF
jgi:hypothetical protein